MQVPTPICIDCKHFKPDWSCAAFPKQIPRVIREGENDHKQPLPDQKNDVVFEKLEK